MRESLAEVLTGAAVVAVAAGFVIWGAQATGLSRVGEQIGLTASFRSVEGIGRGSEVRMAGVRIGTVAAIDLDPETFRAVAVLSLDRDVPVPEDSTAIIASEGLLGGAFVEIFPGGSYDTLSDGGEIVDTQGAVSLLHLLVQYVSGGGAQAQP